MQWLKTRSWWKHLNTFFRSYDFLVTFPDLPRQSSTIGESSGPLLELIECKEGRKEFLWNLIRRQSGGMEFITYFSQLGAKIAEMELAELVVLCMCATEARKSEASS